MAITKHKRHSTIFSKNLHRILSPIREEQQPVSPWTPLDQEFPEMKIEDPPQKTIYETISDTLSSFVPNFLTRSRIKRVRFDLSNNQQFYTFSKFEYDRSYGKRVVVDEDEDYDYDDENDKDYEYDSEQDYCDDDSDNEYEYQKKRTRSILMWYPGVENSI